MDFIEHLKSFILMPLLRIASGFWMLVMIIGWFWFGYTFGTFTHIQFGVTTFSLALATFLPIKDIPAEYNKYMCIAYASTISVSVPGIVLHISNKNYDFAEGILI